mgnify:CR=1 FL=1
MELDKILIEVTNLSKDDFAKISKSIKAIERETEKKRLKKWCPLISHTLESVIVEKKR